MIPIRLIGTAIVALIAFSAYGQKVERVVTTYPNSNSIKEIYYVLKNNKSIKHGEYFLFFDGAIARKEIKFKDINEVEVGLKEKGRFMHNAKDGQWTYFKEPTSTSKLETGQYSKGVKSGVWETFVEDGKVIKRYDYDNNKDLPAIVKVMWKYPSAARRNLIEGIVKVKVTYDSCLANDYQIVSDIGYGCGDAVVDALKEKQKLESKYV